MLFVGTSIIHPSTEGVFLLCNILDLLIYSLKKGFLPDVVEAFFVRKMKGLPLVSTKQDMQDFLKVSTPHYFGGKFTVSNIPYYSEEEELLLWSETSLRGPLISAGYERYMELFKKILPQKAEQINFL